MKKVTGSRKKRGGEWTHVVWTVDNKHYFLKRFLAGSGVEVHGFRIFELTQSKFLGETNRQFRERTRKEARRWNIPHVIGLDPVINCCSRPRPVFDEKTTEGYWAICGNCGARH